MSVCGCLFHSTNQGEVPEYQKLKRTPSESGVPRASRAFGIGSLYMNLKLLFS